MLRIFCVLERENFCRNIACWITSFVRTSNWYWTCVVKCMRIFLYCTALYYHFRCYQVKWRFVCLQRALVHAERLCQFVLTQIGFLSQWDSYAVINLEEVAYSLNYNTVEWFWWNWILSQWPTGFIQCFDTVGWVIWPVKIVPEMTYKVSNGTLSLYSLTHPDAVQGRQLHQHCGDVDCQHNDQLNRNSFCC